MTDTTKTPAKCTSCDQDIPEGASQCPRCGTTFGKQHACPFCSVIVQAKPHPELRFACPACGAPRLASIDNLASPPQALDSLSTARSAKSSRAIWRISLVLAATFGLLSMLMLIGVMSIVGVKLLPLVLGLLIVSVPWAFAVVAFFKARARTRQLSEALDEAWSHAVVQLAQARGKLRASDISRAFGMPAFVVSQLMGRLAARNEIDTDVSEDGELLLSAIGERMRVEPQPMRVSPPVPEQLHEVAEDPQQAQEHEMHEVPADTADTAEAENLQMRA